MAISAEVLSQFSISRSITERDAEGNVSKVFLFNPDTNSYDEALGLPTDESVKIALRTQQIIASETGVADIVDPLAGSYHVEELTATIKEKAKQLIVDLEKKGGVLDCLKMGVQQKMIHESAWKEINDIEENNLFVVGVNCNTEENEEITPAMKIDNENELRQVNKLNNYKKNRDQEKILQELENENLA